MYPEQNGYDTEGPGSRQGRVTRLLDAQSPPQLYTARIENGEVTDVAVGDGICELLGYSCDELESDRGLWMDIIHPDDKGRILAAFQRLMNGEPVFELYRIFRRDGQMRWVRHAVAPAVDESGKVTRIAGMMAPAGVLELAPDWIFHYRAVLEEVPVPICVRDGQGRLFYSNKACARIYGYDEGDEMLGTTYADVIAPESLSDFMSSIYPRIMHGAWNGELALKRKDGSIFYAQGAAFTIRDDHGNPAAIYSVLLDVTDRKFAEEDMYSNISLLRQFIENMPAAVAMLDKDMRYLLVSKRWSADYNLGDRNIIGKSHYEVFPEVPDRWKRIHRRVLAGHVRRSEEDSFLRIGGQQEWVRWELRPWRDSKGEIGGLIMYTEVITERKRAEQALRESRELLTTIQNSIPAEIAVLDRNGVIIAVNEVWERFARDNGDPTLTHTGVGINYLDVCRRAIRAGCDAAAEALEGLSAVLSGHRRVFDMEYSCPSRPRDLWFVMRVAPLLSEQGGLVVSHTDITDRKIAEKALRESEQFLSALTSASPAGVYRTDVEGRCTYVNERWAEMAGMSPEEAMGYGWARALHPDDRPRIEATWYGATASKDMWSDEYRFVTPDGRVTWVLGVSKQLLDEQGNIIGYIGVNSDITSRKLTEEALRASEEKYRTLIENVDAVVFRVDAEMRPMKIAGKVEKFTGWTAQEIMDDPDRWFSIVHADDMDGVCAFLQRICSTKQPGSKEFRIVRRDGAVRWIRAHIAPRFNEQGDLLYYDGIDVDVTEHMEAVQREARHMAHVAALAQISQAIASSLDATQIMDSATQRTAKELQCLCIVLCTDPATESLLVSSVAEHDVERAREAREIIEHIKYRMPGGIDLSSTPSVYDLLPDEISEQVGSKIGPFLVVRLFVEGKPEGLIVGIRAHASQDFEDDDRWFFTEVASYVSAGLTNASLYRRQTRIAETLQRSLIPSVAEVKSLEIATCYLPAVGEAEIGGDFFDMIDFGDDKVGIVVGDVSGKGMEAAIHTAEAKYMLRGYALQNRDPAYVMTALNRAMLTYTSEFTFVTLIYALIDSATHTVSYVNAGHEPPLVLCRDTRTVHEYAPLGPALGIVKDFHYKATTAKLEIDDLLMCYTDGVTDVPRNGDRFGYDRLVKTVAEAHPEHPQHLLDYILRTIREYGQGKQPDDQVIVVVGPRI